MVQQRRSSFSSEISTVLTQLCRAMCPDHHRVAELVGAVNERLADFCWSDYDQLTLCPVLANLVGEVARSVFRIRTTGLQQLRSGTTLAGGSTESGSVAFPAPSSAPTPVDVRPCRPRNIEFSLTFNAQIPPPSEAGFPTSPRECATPDTDRVIPCNVSVHVSALSAGAGPRLSSGSIPTAARLTSGGSFMQPSPLTLRQSAPAHRKQHQQQARRQRAPAQSRLETPSQRSNSAVSATEGKGRQQAGSLRPAVQRRAQSSSSNAIAAAPRDPQMMGLDGSVTSVPWAGDELIRIAGDGIPPYPLCVAGIGTVHNVRISGNAGAVLADLPGMCLVAHDDKERKRPVFRAAIGPLRTHIAAARKDALLIGSRSASNDQVIWTPANLASTLKRHRSNEYETTGDAS